MKKIKFLIVFIYVSQLIAQDTQFDLTNFQDQTVHASPTASSLGSYGASPVSLANGTPNITVPIWNLSGSSISTSINLSYRPGVKIEQLSEYTGMGWSLQGGGVITRKIVGSPDGANQINRIQYHPERENPLPYNHAEDSGFLDWGSDIYNYNFPGYSGQFALNDDLSIYYLKEYQNWKFSFTENEIKIIDQNGTIYLFSDKEYSLNPYDDSEGNSMGPQPVVAWYLTSITSATVNERIEFTYYNESINDAVPRQRQLLLKMQNTLAPTQNTSQIRDITFHDGVSYQSKKLESIILYKNNIATSKVTFEATTYRDDLQKYVNTNVNENNFALSKISIFKNAQDTQPIKYFDFNIASGSRKNRIYLFGIQEFSGDGTASKAPYSFDYYNINDLPDRFSFQSDYWGYYSKYGAEYPAHPSFKWYGDPKKTKVPSFPEAQYGSLKRITFPTGGLNEFSYELNGYHKTITNTDLLSLKLDWAATHWRNSNNQASNQETLQFTLDQSKTISIDATLQYRVNLTTTGWGTVASEAQEHQISIVNVNNPNVPIFLFSFDGEGDPDEIDQVLHGGDPNIVYLPPTYTANGTQSITIGGSLYQDLKINLPAGTYRAIIKTPSPTNSDNLFGKMSIDIKVPNGFIDAEIPVKGIRIANQKLIDTDDEVLKDIDYSYKVHDENGNATNKSSGQMPDQLIIRAEAINSQVTYYTLHETLNSWHEPGVPSNKTYRDPINSANIGLCYTEKFGNAGSEYLADVCLQTYTFLREAVFYRNSKFANHTDLGYKEVRVEEDGNGFTLHKFNALDHTKGYDLRGYYVAKATYKYVNGNIVLDANPAGNYSGAGTDGLTNRNSYAWPYMGNSITSTLWKMPKETLTFKKNPDTSIPVLIKQQNYEYQKVDQPKLYQIDMHTYAGNLFYIHFVSDISNDIYRLASRSNKDYDQAGENPISTTTAYKYIPGYSIPNKISTVDSQGGTQIKKIKYSFEYENAGFGPNSSISTDDLFDANIIVPIEEQFWELEATVPKLLGGRLNIYDKISASSNPSNLYKPIEILNLEISTIPNNTGTALIDEYNESYHGDNLDWYNAISGYKYDNTGVDLTYDQNGNLIQVTPKDGTPVSYIWGYNQQYPVAKIENASRAQVEALSGFGANFHTGVNGLSTTQENTLRTNLPNAMITTYTYKPLIGITSMTDPRGYNMTYHYDKLNRLEFVKDQNGHLVSENKYNYKN
ncbi:hypothetical protein [Aquimarina sp. AD10]|uniref:hypothetical protein n=1 Tax=Aquimarina sp. AD10 TaxID=1714849 RepID=UPI0011C4A026|nr:hypothetical protein [Aquimarina sp. AD10]